MSEKYCKSCGVLWSNHSGCQSICAENIQLRKLLSKIAHELKEHFPAAMNLPVVREADKLLDERG